MLFIRISYTGPTIANIITADIIPIITPSTINGPLINPFVAPTYFIIEISLLRAYTVSFIVYAIINTDITININNNTNVAIWIPFATLAKLDIVSSLLVISSTPSSYSICSWTCLFNVKSVNVTKYDAGNGLSSAYVSSKS